MRFLWPNNTDEICMRKRYIYSKYIKRILDTLAALVGLPVLAILFLLIAPAIYLEDRGPIFFFSKRIGRHGKLFTIWKFRSMYVDAPDIRLVDGSTYNDNNDPRVTRVGRFLRKTSLDELPQLVNILKGDMSLIGPRPDPPDWLCRYPENVKVFLKAKPGITGYNQAYFRNLADSTEKMCNDVYYAMHCSFPLDARIFLKTVSTVLLQKNTTRSETGKGIGAGQAVYADMFVKSGKGDHGTHARS